MCNKMSDVRLSNASPTLERVDARQPENVRPSVRRNLFGRPDPEEIRRYVAASIQEDVRGFTETYNFDPVNDRPLAPRNYAWQEDRDAPEFYVRPPHGSQPPRRQEDLPGENSRLDAEEERSERRQNRPGGSKKRRAAPCSSECQSKRSHTDDDDDDDEDQSTAGSQSVTAAEERPSSSRPESCAEVL